MYDRKKWQKKPWGYLGVGKMKNLEISTHSRDGWMLGSWTGKGSGRKHQHGTGTLEEMFALAEKMRKKKPKKDWDGTIDGIDLGFRAASLRSKLIRLAHAKPELRKDLLPLLEKTARYMGQLDGAFGSPKELAKLMGATVVLNSTVPKNLAISKPYLYAKTKGKDGSFELICIGADGEVKIYGWDKEGDLSSKPDWDDDGRIVYTGDKKKDWKALKKFI